ncbi:MAG: hypothetical protein CM1200mP3_10310 [Chloroflexota bacterium]|nr:MAG: hypothetical protein CM1200mP3_10310 [Chloroflexota bacterium]
MTQEHTATIHGEHEETQQVLTIVKCSCGHFWFDCMFFGALIATYLVYKGKSLTGPMPVDVFDIPVTSVSTFVL